MWKNEHIRTTRTSAIYLYVHVVYECFHRNVLKVNINPFKLPQFQEFSMQLKFNHMADSFCLLAKLKSLHFWAF